MKVLYVLGNYPKISETYVAAEIKFMTSHGVEIRVWTCGGSTAGMAEPVPVYRGGFQEALQSFKPDLVHVHYLVVHYNAIDAAGRAGIPVSVRGHSFDFSRHAVESLSGRSWVRRFYLFPHFAEAFPGNPKVMGITVAYDPDGFPPGPKDRRLVLRTTAAKPNKGLGDFIRAAELCPNHRFTLVANVVEPGWMPTLRAMAGSRVQLREDLPNEEAARLTGLAGIYLDTSDPGGHPFGMPISVAEAMGTGSLVLIRESPAAVAYVGQGGMTYRSAEDAARIIRETLAWDEPRWDEVRARATARAAFFAAGAVLPRMLEDWHLLTGR